MLIGLILKFSGIVKIYSYTTSTINDFLDIRNLHITYLVQRSERFVLNFRAEENDDVWDTTSEDGTGVEGSSLDGGSSIASITKRRAGNSALQGMLVVGVQRNRKSSTNLGIFSFSTFLMLFIKVVLLVITLVIFYMVDTDVGYIMRIVRGPKASENAYNLGIYISQL